MLTSWLKPTRRPAAPTLALHELEDRSVPATFYVDPTLAGQPDDSTQNFNTGNPTAVTGLVFGNSTGGSRVLFPDLAVAIAASEINAGPDTIILANNANIPLTNTFAAPDNVAVSQGNETNITQTLNIFGAGSGASVVRPTDSTRFFDADFPADGVLNDPGTALIRVGTGGNLTAVGFRLDGSGLEIGTGFTIADGAQAILQRVAVSGTVFDSANAGAAVVVQNTASATLDRVDLSNFGKNGLLVRSADAILIDSTVTGRGAADFLTNGVEANGGTILVTGSTISNNTGVVGGFQSGGIVALNGFVLNPGQASVVTAVGNRIFGNAIGLSSGAGVTDNSALVAQFNNITDNGIAIDARTASVQIAAPNNYFGSPNGPFNATSNPSGRGDQTAGTNVNVTPFLTSPTPVRGVFGGVAGYPDAIASAGLAINAFSSVLNTTVPAEVRFEAIFTGFSLPLVTGFDASDVIAQSSAGTPLTVTVVPRGFDRFILTVTPTSGTFSQNDTIAVFVQPKAATISANNGQGEGFQNGVSNLATISINSPTPAAPAAPGDASGELVTFLAEVAAVPVTRSILTTTTTPAVIDAPAPTVNAGTEVAPTVDALPAEVAVPTVETEVEQPLVRLFAVGADAGSGPEVQVYSADGSLRERVQAFEETFTGGVHVATGDVTGDGVDDLVFGAGVGGGPRVQIRDGATGATIADFFAYDAAFRNGVFVAVGDTDGDGVDEVVTGAGFGGGPHVKVFSGAGVEQLGFFAFDSELRGGATVATGDLDGDGQAEIIAGAGAGGSPEVVVLNGAGVVQSRFLAYESDFTGGVNVAVVPADSIPGVIVTGPGAGRDPEIREFSASGDTVTAFDAFESSFDGGVRVGTTDVNADGAVDIVAVPGPGGGPRVRGFNLIGDPILDGFAFDGVGNTGLTVG